MKISDSQIRKGIIKEHAKVFLYDTVTSTWDWDSILVVRTFDKIDGRFIDFHIRHIAVYQSQQLHNIIQHVKHNKLDNNRREKEMRRIRQYFRKSFGITMSEERYDNTAELTENILKYLNRTYPEITTDGTYRVTGWSNYIYAPFQVNVVGVNSISGVTVNTTIGNTKYAI